MKENDVIWVSIEESDKIDMLQLNKLVFIIEILISYCLQALLENVLNF